MSPLQIHPSHNPPPTPEERAAIIRSVVSSMALSGVEISQDLAERLYDQALSEPLLVSPGVDEGTP